jgi:putative two-component system hydrogenase maturation factor HypX/HoxX
VIVLEGGSDFFSTGIHLNVIEAADDPARESWRNLTAIDDLVRAIVETPAHAVIAALGGDAGAGGVPLALAADHVVAREDVVLNPYYSHMGGLYGSEYWTYLLPRLVGSDVTERLVGPPFAPIGAAHAVEIGLIDAAFGATLADFRERVRGLAERLARDPGLDRRLEHKRLQRDHDERVKPLHAYRTEELLRSKQSFFEEGSGYHDARSRFVRKLPAPATPVPGEWS